MDQKKKVAIALQGGGAHGAFAWGVIDRLLEDGRFDIVGVSGTSAGGMNAACTVQGLIQGDNKTARDMLTQYWTEMSKLSKKISPISVDPISKAMKYYNLDKNPMFQLSKAMQGLFSPYDTNPLNLNPFEDFLKGFFDFDAVRNSEDRKIFLGSTHVKTGKIKIFKNKDFSPEVLIASACLPFLFQASQIDGEYYWDGGFIANPAIYPLINECDCRDIIVVQLTRSICEDLPRSMAEITDRLKEITYNGCLVREIRAIYFISSLIDKGIINEGALKRINLHMIKNEYVFKGLNLSSALNTDWDFLQMLHGEGRQSAHQWINDHFDKVGSKQHSFDKNIYDDFVSEDSYAVF